MVDVCWVISAMLVVMGSVFSRMASCGSVAW